METHLNWEEWAFEEIIDSVGLGILLAGIGREDIEKEDTSTRPRKAPFPDLCLWHLFFPSFFKL